MLVIARSWLVSCRLLGRTWGGLVGSVLFYDFPLYINSLKDRAKMKIKKEKTVAFVGSDNLAALRNATDRNLENVIRTELLFVIEEFYKDGKDTFLSALDSGFEMLAAEVVLEYAEAHEGIRLYAVTDDKVNMPVRHERVLEAVSGRLVVPEKEVHDFLVENSSEIVVYGSGKMPILEQAERSGVEAWNMYEEIKGYLSIQSPVKQYLQDYPKVSSFRYGREGVIFRGHNQPFPVTFAEISRVERQDDMLHFTLRDGMVIMASLISDSCYVKLPPHHHSGSGFLC